MRMIVKQFALLAALAAVPMAKADTYHFSFTASGNPQAGDFSFDLPSSPTMSYVDPHGYYSETQVTPIVAGGESILSVTSWFSGGFKFDSGDFELTGATLFTGNLDHPTFRLGEFSMAEFAPGDPTDRGLLVVSNVTPEPASLWLLGTGAAGLAAAVRRRRTA